MRLSGKRALITGADGGIGAALTAGLAGAGAEVVLHSRRSGGAAALCEDLRRQGHSAETVHGDVRSAEQVQAFVDDATANGRALDILVNNAGQLSTTPFLELSEEEFIGVIDTNLSGYFRVGQAVCRRMADAGWGSVINIASTRQVQAWPGNTAYATSKGGVAMLTRSMALELAPLGIRVNSVAPGTFLTNLNRDYLSDPEFVRGRIRQIPMGRLGEVDELIGAVLYLASDDASFTTGASIMIDGGQTLW